MAAILRCSSMQRWTLQLITRLLLKSAMKLKVVKIPWLKMAVKCFHMCNKLFLLPILKTSAAQWNLIEVNKHQQQQQHIIIILKLPLKNLRKLIKQSQASSLHPQSRRRLYTSKTNGERIKLNHRLAKIVPSIGGARRKNCRRKLLRKCRLSAKSRSVSLQWNEIWARVPSERWSLESTLGRAKKWP